MKVLLLSKFSISDYVFNDLYYSPLSKLLKDNLLSFDKSLLKYDENNKSSTVLRKDFLNNIKDKVAHYNIILISDGEYFKTATKKTQSEKYIGDLVYSSLLDNYVMYIPTHLACARDFRNKAKIQIVFQNISDFTKGVYSDNGKDILNNSKKLTNLNEIEKELSTLIIKPSLAVDIETYSLKYTEAGIATIAFADSNNKSIAFPVEHSQSKEVSNQIKVLLKNFFINFKGKLIFHKSNYDVPILIYELFMDRNINNLERMHIGLNSICKNLEDTLIITYLATNSCSGNKLDLKSLSAEFAGDYAVDVSDVSKVDLNKLLDYNNVDTLSTWYVYNKYSPLMVSEEQDEIYKSFFLPTLKNLIRMQIHGLILDNQKVINLNNKLNQRLSFLNNQIQQNKYVQQVIYENALKKTRLKNLKLKTKKSLIEDNYEEFNINSNKHLITLFHEVLKLPVLDCTPTKQPKVGKKNIEQLLDFAKTEQEKDLINNILEYLTAVKLITGFIPSFLKAHNPNNGPISYLHGYFNLGGTKSGRLSSSNVNLQNLPSTGTPLAKLVKECFVSTPEWIFCGIDFSSLEDRISALTTKDSNKLKVYLEGYDGHCLRAYNYFSDQMPDINPNDVDSINSIASKYPKLRQDSKAPTFLLTYGGTNHGLVKNCGLDKSTALTIEQKYHELYQESDMWVASKIREACNTGYITTGFGLKLRTPLLKNTLYSENLQGVAHSEAKTAGNALGQGWGVLNDRARNEIIEKIDENNLEFDVLPVAAIHDANYFLVRNDPDLIAWLNKTAVKACEWNNHPDIYHETVGLGGELDLFIPDWSKPVTLPKDATPNEIKKIIEENL